MSVADSKYHSTVSLTVTKSGDGCWNAILKVSFGGENLDDATFRGLVEFEGDFVVKADFPEEKTESLVRMNGGAILYGAVRELVLNLTARSKHGPFELPTIDARMFLTPIKE